MATPTYEIIASYTTTGSATSINFNSIPQTYTDLRVIGNWQTATAGMDFFCQINATSYTGYNNEWRVNTSGGTLPGSLGTYSTRVNFTNSFSGTYDTSSVNVFDFYNYADTTFQKTVSAKNSQPLGTVGSFATYIQMFTGGWNTTNAITSLTFSPSGSNFVDGSPWTLYGIKKA
jgi:hypothetical protein